MLTTCIGLAALAIIAAVWRNVWVEDVRREETAEDAAWLKGRSMVKHPKY